MGRIQWISRRTRGEVGELRADGLADDQGTGPLQQGDRLGFVTFESRCGQLRTGRRGQTIDAEDVLDPQRYTEERAGALMRRPQLTNLFAQTLEPARLVDECVNPGLDLVKCRFELVECFRGVPVRQIDPVIEVATRCYRQLSHGWVRCLSFAAANSTASTMCW